MDDHALQTAGSLTFTSLLAMVPLLTVALSLATAFPVFGDATDALQRYVIENFLPEAAGVKAIAEQVTAFTQQAGKLTAIGLVFLAVTAIMLMLTIDDAMGRVFRVRRARPLSQRILMYWAVLTLGPILIGMSLSMTTFLVGASLGRLSLDGLAQEVLRVVPFLFTWAALALVYFVVPNRRITPWHALTGALVAGVLFEVAKRGFAMYIERVPTYTLIYGAFATLPIFLLWVYLSWLVILVGATIAAMLPQYGTLSRDTRRVPGEELRIALAVLTELARAQQGGAMPDAARLANRSGIAPYECETILERCAELGWAARTDRDGWLLARDAGSLSVADVYRGFVMDAGAQPSELGDQFEHHWQHVAADLGTTLRELMESERR